MIHQNPRSDQPGVGLRIVRHAQVREKIGLSEAKLFDMIAKGIFPKPFKLVSGGRAVGWIESDVDQWILDRKQGDC